MNWVGGYGNVGGSRWSGDLILFVGENRLALSDFKQSKQHRRHKQVEGENPENPSISLKSFFAAHFKWKCRKFHVNRFRLFFEANSTRFSMFHSHLHNKSEHPTTSRELMNN